MLFRSDIVSGDDDDDGELSGGERGPSRDVLAVLAVMMLAVSIVERIGGV